MMKLQVRIASLITCTVFASQALGATASPSPAPAAAAAPAPAKAPAVKQGKQASSEMDDSVFRKKLGEMLSRTEKSIKLLREQIIQNQSAPFLADLYLQLADLLAEKANVLYYQKIEKEKDSNVKLNANEKFNPIVIADQEAIAIYQQILKEFPNFNKRDKTLYRMAVAQKAIDDSAPFVVTSENLIKEFPKTKEAMQVRLLLGQFYMDQQDLKSAKTAFTPVSDSPFPYERNSARYRLGIINMTDEKFKDALELFKKVATDEELKEEDNPLEVSVKDRTVHSDIKREALIDSIRAYTEVFKKDPDPINFYSQVTPTEVLFQEVIEKLAYRYIFLKNQGQAMKLLRALSERVADPAKVVSVYREVLSIIPPLERVEVPPQELQYVLDKYGAWLNDFEIGDKVRNDSYEFFENQIREMGTRSHDLAKSELSQTRKDFLYERARLFYLLYLGFFKKGNLAVKMATDLADVYYYKKNYMVSGDYYLRIFQGEFGPPTNQDSLLQNAIMAFQNKAPNDFYEITRSRGLLYRSIQTYIQFNPKKKSDAKLNFVLAKTVYEQGLYDKALPGLVDYIQRFPGAHTEDEAAADVILDYFNTRSDFKGLIEWSTRLLKISSLAPDLRKRLESVKSKAMLKQIDEAVKSKADYDPFGQGKGYFEAAMSLHDDTMKSVALEQALARSKSEKDYQTFLKVAKVMADGEKTPDKKAQIILGMAEQTLAMGMFYRTLQLWRDTIAIPGLPAGKQQQVREKMVQLLLMLKDWSQVQNNARGVNSTLTTAVNAQFGEYMEGATVSREDFISRVPLSSVGDSELVSFFKGMFKTPGGTQANIFNETNKRCGQNHSSSLCRWFEARKAPTMLAELRGKLGKAAATVATVEPMANALNGFVSNMKIFSETGDPQLDAFASLYLGKAYSEFAVYLNRVGIANPPVAQVLKAKANESMVSAQAETTRCSKIIESASLVSPLNGFCRNGRVPTLKEAMTWSRTVSDSNKGTDPKSPGLENWQKKIFVEHDKPDPYIELAHEFYKIQDYHHALAMATYGISTFPQAKDEFTTIQGCALVAIGLYGPGQFQLRAGGDYEGLKARCLATVKERTQ